MFIHHYHSVTKEYLSSTEARLDPIDQQPVIPANATDKPVPATNANEAAIFQDDDWVVVPDYRGEVYYNKTTQEQITVTEINVSPDPNWTDIAPTDPDEIWAVDHWQVPHGIMIERKCEEMESACKAECGQGLVSNVLGTDHYYGSRTSPHHDQLNMIAMFNKARLHENDDPAWPGAELTCSEDGGFSFVRKVHTAAQIIAVAEDIQEMVSNAQNKLLNNIYPAIDAAADQAALDLIVWV